MSVDIEMLRGGMRWSFDKSEINFGREADSDVRLGADEYLMVSRRHALLRIVAEHEMWLEDQNSFNGTLINGSRIVGRERLSSGDVIRLGDDGPEFRVSVSTARPGTDPHVRATAGLATNTPPLGSYSAPTSFSGGGSHTPPPTQYGVPKSAYGSDTAVPSAAAAKPAPTQYAAGARPAGGGFATTSRTPAPEVPTHMPSTSGGGLQAPVLSASAQMRHPNFDEFAPGEEAMLERKIAITRNLLFAVIILCLVLGGVVVYQGQEIRKTRETLNAMQRQAENAVGQFMPQLNGRLNRFDSRLDDFQGKMDQMDGNMKRAEDRFVTRMDTEMPKIMDRYIQMKANEIQRGANAKVQVR
jgi:hypothetical protein